MRFSERHGYKPIREIVQIDSMDEPLRNALWSTLQIHIWDYAKVSKRTFDHYSLSNPSNAELKLLCNDLWVYYFKKPLDTLDDDWENVLRELRENFFSCRWYEVYDFIEFCASNYIRPNFKEGFVNWCNASLERETSAYRFIDGLITQITEKEQLDEIQESLDKSRGPVHTHLRRSLELLSDRETPDYRNSIKESISAVESLVGLVVGSTGTLGQLIKKLEDEIDLHPSLKTAFSKLYGYTSDNGGIRHALLKAESIQFEDAKFFLVVCSAFINFVESKVENKG